MFKDGGGCAGDVLGVALFAARQWRLSGYDEHQDAKPEQ
jgi:hypothetical protein